VPILVVEDDASTRGLLSTLLTGAGFTVLEAETGQRAIDLLEGGARPRLMIVDLMLPRVSGADVLRYAHEDDQLRRVPKVVITGTGREKLQNVVADAVFTKPVDPSALLQTIKRLTTPAR
jgi:CheY-like chemotaxis protein